MIDIIIKYFPNLSVKQQQQLISAMEAYKEWNSKINVISRKDIDNLELNHILHSLSIAKFIKFSDNSSIMDLGSGGGLPGIPLAIIFPNCHFHLIDRVGKKMAVATEVARTADIKNVSIQHGDVGECKDKFDFVVSRGVMPQPDLARLARKNISKKQFNSLPNGLISLKGGELHAELGKLADISEIVPISSYFNEPFFDTKKIVYTPIFQ